MARKLTREKVAFLVFILLIVGGAIALASYFLAARTLNVAANQVDDTLGMMNDYTVIVYPGTTPEPVAEGSEPQQAESSEEDEAVHAAAESAEGVEEAIDAENSSVAAPLTVAEVFRQYTLKGAAVLSLDDATPDAYLSPRIFRVGHRSVGVVAIDSYCTHTRLAPLTDHLREEGADIVCVITPRRDWVGDPTLATIVLVTGSDEDLTTSGTNDGTTFIVASPQIGDVGVIAISSSNVVSASLIEGS